LGRLLARLREKRGLAQKQAAHLAEIDGSTLSRLESGDRGVSREVLDRIATRSNSIDASNLTCSSRLVS
jgi:transcriptional regulator with XRE-family HTH domain